jgi:ABC-2 type transport system permease protein
VTVRPVLLIAGKDLRQRFRDRSAIVLGFIAPLAIAFLMSAAFGGASDLHVTIGLVDEDRGPIAEAITGTFASPELEDLFTVERHDRGAAQDAVDGGDVDAALVIPEGFSEAVTSGEAADVEVLASVDNPLSAAVTRAVADRVLTQVQATRIAVATAIATGASPADAAALAARAADRPPAVSLSADDLGGRELDMISYYAPGMAIFFVLNAIGFTARSWFTEAAQGTLDRMVAAPIPRRTVLAGKALSVAVYGTASLATMAVVTGLAFGAHWGPPAAVAAVILAMVVAIVALTALVIAATRTEQQAEGLASILTFTLALLGGNFIFVATAPEAMRRAALLTPNGWAMRGITDLSTGAAATSVLVPIAAILGFAAVTATGAAIASRRSPAR